MPVRFIIVGLVFFCPAIRCPPWFQPVFVKFSADFGIALFCGFVSKIDEAGHCSLSRMKMIARFGFQTAIRGESITDIHSGKSSSKFYSEAVSGFTVIFKHRPYKPSGCHIELVFGKSAPAIHRYRAGGECTGLYRCVIDSADKFLCKRKGLLITVPSGKSKKTQQHLAAVVNPATFVFGVGRVKSYMERHAIFIIEAVVQIFPESGVR